MSSESINTISHTARLLQARMGGLLGRYKGHTCVIVGTDGFDLCVSINLVLFYTYLGFNVVFSIQPIPADLIVFMRYPGDATKIAKEFEEAIPKDTPVHIYAYVGVNTVSILSALKDYPVLLLAPSEELIPTNNGNYFLTFPPVFPEFWARPPAEREYPIVHIGNGKSKGTGMETWKDEQDLLRALCRPDAHVWGKFGWDTTPGIANWHGELKIAHVPKIYARTKFALGLMYPFQHEVKTFSSRFWQAPLCGAALIVEKHTSKIFPGIYPRGLDNIDGAIRSIKDTPEEIYRNAVNFWLLERGKTVKILVSALEEMPPRSHHHAPSDLVWIADPIVSIASGGIGPEFAFKGLES